MLGPPPAALVASRTVIACWDGPELVELERLNLNHPALVARPGVHALRGLCAVELIQSSFTAVSSVRPADVVAGEDCGGLRVGGQKRFQTQLRHGDIQRRGERRDRRDQPHVTVG